jgi:hypothetical protein
MSMITPERREELAAQIEPRRQQVEAWRQSRSRRSQPMPEPLWEAATALAKSYGVSPVQRILRIDYRGLEYRALGVRKGKAQGRTARPTGTTFVELPALTPARRAEHLVELEDGTGRKLTVRVSGGTLGEVVPLIQAFWRPTA